jgi:hypothetical protein
MTDRLSLPAFDRYLPGAVRSILEERFLQGVEEASTLEAASGDSGFISAPDEHPALFADHGIVHARDVATGVLELEPIANGCLLPARPDDRREFVTALAVLLAFLHDVGMSDPAPEGRRIHAVHAAQISFSGAMDDVLALLDEEGSAIHRRIEEVNAASPFLVEPSLVLRELAALAVLHSKSTVPGAVVGDLSRLRQVLQRAVLVDLEEHRRAPGALVAGDELPDALGSNARRYDDPVRDAFAWLDSEEAAQQAFADDAVDAARLVRASDALRQRGTTLRTAAGYEIFVDVATGQAVISLRNASGDRLVLLRSDSQFSAGEANIRKAEMTPKGDLRISFHRGRFSSPEAAATASAAAARVVADIAEDVLGAFAHRRPTAGLTGPARVPSSMRAELERPADEPGFADVVAGSLADVDPLLASRFFVVADLENAVPAERERYLAGSVVSGDTAEADEILAELGARGLRVTTIDRRDAFEDVRRVRIEVGEVLVAAGTPSAFVYIPVGCRLRIEQLGGYRDIDVPPWIPIGVTGVVRRAERNSTVIASEAGEALMIPGELFAREWFRPYGQRELAEALATVVTDPDGEPGTP